MSSRNWVIGYTALSPVRGALANKSRSVSDLRKCVISRGIRAHRYRAPITRLKINNREIGFSCPSTYVCNAMLDFLRKCALTTLTVAQEGGKCISSLIALNCSSVRHLARKKQTDSNNANVIRDIWYFTQSANTQYDNFIRAASYTSVIRGFRGFFSCDCCARCESALSMAREAGGREMLERTNDSTNRSLLSTGGPAIQSPRSSFSGIQDSRRCLRRCERGCFFTRSRVGRSPIEDRDEPGRTEKLSQLARLCAR